MNPPNVWSGGYIFARGDHLRFVGDAEDVAKKYVRVDLKDRPADADFRNDLERLAKTAPPGDGGRLLLEEMKYAWNDPDRSASLYVLTLTLRAPAGRKLVAPGGKMVKNRKVLEDAKLVEQLRCTKSETHHSRSPIECIDTQGKNAWQGSGRRGLTEPPASDLRKQQSPLDAE
jgi:hypothetical protein